MKMLRRWWNWIRQEHTESDCWCVPRRYRKALYESVPRPWTDEDELVCDPFGIQGRIARLLELLEDDS